MPDRTTELLTATATRIAWPQPTDLAVRVRSEIAARPTVSRPGSWWRVAYAAAALIAIAGSVLVFSPATRRAVADLLGIGGVRITFDDRVPTPALGAEYDFGRAVTLNGARAGVDFEVPVPDVSVLGHPNAVFFDEDTPPGGQVALIYGPRPQLPAAAGQDASVIFTVFPADLSTGEFFKKVGVAGTRVTATKVGGQPAYWLEGEPHLFYYEDPTRGVTAEDVRLVGNVLLWEAADLTLRLEVGNLSLERALEIAGSVE